MSRYKTTSGRATDLLCSRYVRGTKIEMSILIKRRIKYNRGLEWSVIFDTFGVFSKPNKKYRRFQYILAALHIAMTQDISIKKIVSNLKDMLELVYV